MRVQQTQESEVGGYHAIRSHMWLHIGRRTLEDRSANPSKDRSQAIEPVDVLIAIVRLDSPAHQSHHQHVENCIATHLHNEKMPICEKE